MYETIQTVLAAVYELYIAATGGDWGYGALTDVLGGNEPLAETVVNSVDLSS